MDGRLRGALLGVIFFVLGIMVIATFFMVFTGRSSETRSVGYESGIHAYTVDDIECGGLELYMAPSVEYGFGEVSLVEESRSGEDDQGDHKTMSCRFSNSDDTFGVFVQYTQYASEEDSGAAHKDECSRSEQIELGLCFVNSDSVFSFSSQQENIIITTFVSAQTDADGDEVFPDETYIDFIDTHEYLTQRAIAMNRQ